MTLELCQKDFEALIRRFQLFEQQQLQPKYANGWNISRIVMYITYNTLSWGAQDA